ncbi:hypothetical protein SODALDRAFT_161768 [Sodiomyces alkalinus F11]|uniref:Uncharacterized protein n=1 Tax=Sodiomyces alkalinus (strain CBS 110278 / VKM F-3762 / F11) TaxID=1314773 RepID=A0A3N2PVM9_SODAK|nr:hypothetical protein SODALDRAFT_161768 [Sodiomyces alkalinus F11]ROT38406.1 hypothetical protein SODALDRAFT_161768 [Sodiomyces alkalinus F11]
MSVVDQCQSDRSGRSCNNTSDLLNWGGVVLEYEERQPARQPINMSDVPVRAGRCTKYIESPLLSSSSGGWLGHRKRPFSSASKIRKRLARVVWLAAIQTQIDSLSHLRDNHRWSPAAQERVCARPMPNPLGGPCSAGSASSTTLVWASSAAWCLLSLISRFAPSLVSCHLLQFCDRSLVML